MPTKSQLQKLENIGRIRLSRHFFLRDFLHSEIAVLYGRHNTPDDIDLAVAAGAKLCTELLEPLEATFGRIAIRSAFRSCEVNGIGAENQFNCASNESNYAGHIWDRRDRDGNMGATACIVIPWLVDRPHYDWRAMAWWIHDHLPYSRLQFFPKLTAFNITWRENPEKVISSYVAPLGNLTKPGMDNHAGSHGDWYKGFPDPVFPAA